MLKNPLPYYRYNWYYWYWISGKKCIMLYKTNNPPDEAITPPSTKLHFCFLTPLYSFILPLRYWHSNKSTIIYTKTTATFNSCKFITHTTNNNLIQINVIAKCKQFHTERKMLFDVGITTNLTDAVEVDNDLNGLGGGHGPFLHAGRGARRPRPLQPPWKL